MDNLGALTSTNYLSESRLAALIDHDSINGWRLLVFEIILSSYFMGIDFYIGLAGNLDKVSAYFKTSTE